MSGLKISSKLEQIWYSCSPIGPKTPKTYKTIFKYFIRPSKNVKYCMQFCDFPPPIFRFCMMLIFCTVPHWGRKQNKKFFFRKRQLSGFVKKCVFLHSEWENENALWNLSSQALVNAPHLRTQTVYLCTSVVYTVGKDQVLVNTFFFLERS